MQLLFKNILILGSISNTATPSYLASKYFFNKGFNVFALSSNNILSKELRIIDEKLDPNYKQSSIDIISIFVNPKKQIKYYKFILSLHPKRIIFNPGTENDELILLAKSKNIEVIKGCSISLFVNGIIQYSSS